MADAANVFAMDAIRSRTGKRVEPIEIEEVELRNAIERFYASRARAQVQMTGPNTTDLNTQITGSEFVGDLDQQLVRCWTRRRWCASSSRSSATRCA